MKITKTESDGLTKLVQRVVETAEDAERLTDLVGKYYAGIEKYCAPIVSDAGLPTDPFAGIPTDNGLELPLSYANRRFKFGSKKRYATELLYWLGQVRRTMQTHPLNLDDYTYQTIQLVSMWEEYKFKHNFKSDILKQRDRDLKLSESGQKGAKGRWQDQAEIHAEWQRKADEEWKRNALMSKAQVAKRIKQKFHYLEHIDTIRKVIKKRSGE